MPMATLATGRSLINVRGNKNDLPRPAVGSVWSSAELTAQGFKPMSITPPRVLVLAPQPFYEDRGTPIAVRHLLEALCELEYHVDLLTYPVGASIDLPNLHIRRVGTTFRFKSVPIGFSMRKLVLDFALIPAFLSQLRKIKYTCVHAVEEAAFIATRAAHGCQIPMIYDMQSSIPEQLLKPPLFGKPILQYGLRYLEQRLIRNADSIVCSAGLKDYVQALDPHARVREWLFPSNAFSCSSKEIRLIRKGLGIKSHNAVVLYTGNAEAYQGLDKLLGAAPSVLTKIPHAIFVFVGVEDGQHPLTAECEELKRKGILIFVKRQPRELMPKYMAIADVLVAPREPIGNVPLKVFDYLAAGKPIVATDCPSFRTVLDDNRALLVSPHADKIAEAIVALLHDKEKAAKMATAAQAYARKRLGWHAFVGLVADIYQQAVAEHRNIRGRTYAKKWPDESPDR
jgi:glycosyltransferase involved in cell wall biosynthesis